MNTTVKREMHLSSADGIVKSLGKGLSEEAGSIRNDFGTDWLRIDESEFVIDGLEIMDALEYGRDIRLSTETERDEAGRLVTLKIAIRFATREEILEDLSVIRVRRPRSRTRRLPSPVRQPPESPAVVSRGPAVVRNAGPAPGPPAGNGEVEHDGHDDRRGMPD